MENKSRRKNYFIKRRFQTNFFIHFIFLLVAEGAIISALFFYVSTGTITAAYKGSDFILDKTSTFFFSDFLVISCIVALAIVIAAVFVFIIITHRIAGALYRFEKTFEDVGKGDFSIRMNLRRTDELKDLKDKFNIFLEIIDRDLNEVKKDAEKVNAVAAKAKTAQDIQEVRDTLKKLDTSLGRFKTSK